LPAMARRVEGGEAVRAVAVAAVHHPARAADRDQDQDPEGGVAQSHGAHDHETGQGRAHDDVVEEIKSDEDQNTRMEPNTTRGMVERRKDICM